MVGLGIISVMLSPTLVGAYTCVPPYYTDNGWLEKWLGSL
jgi:hypothetical protein